MAGNDLIEVEILSIFGALSPWICDESSQIQTLRNLHRLEGTDMEDTRRYLQKFHCIEPYRFACTLFFQINPSCDSLVTHLQ